MNEKPTVLIAALDWGLGHATRCISLIHHMKMLDFEVIIAAEGAHAAVLREEFPEIRQVHLKGYRLKYGKSGLKTLLKLLGQIPKILTAIKYENRWLTGFLEKNRVDLLISDNRYGFYHKGVRSVFITHQLQIKTPFGKGSETILRKLNYRYIRNFSECWVPDHRGMDNLGGDLSHPTRLPPVPVKYLGILTRFNKTADLPVYDLLILLSGPEPQRTLLEQIVLKELKNYKGKAVMLRGLPANDNQLPDLNNTRFFNHLPTGRLNQLINESAIVLSRPGYTTIMDMAALQKKCIFIPTPGQTEQQYLAAYLSRKLYCLSFDQDKFSLSAALSAINSVKLRTFNLPTDDSDLQEVMNSL